MDEQTAKLVEIELEVSRLSSAEDARASGPEYVKGPTSGCIHHIAVMTGQPIWWMTRCTYEFGRVEHELLSELPPGYKSLCSKCFPQLRLDRKSSAS
mgnify:FL=1